MARTALFPLTWVSLEWLNVTALRSVSGGLDELAVNLPEQARSAIVSPERRYALLLELRIELRPARTLDRRLAGCEPHAGNVVDNQGVGINF